MARDRVSQRQEARRVYDLHVKPVERAHAGEHVLVTPDGQSTFAPTFEEVMRRAHQQADQRNFIFKVGTMVLGRV